VTTPLAGVDACFQGKGRCVARGWREVVGRHSLLRFSARTGISLKLLHLALRLYIEVADQGNASPQNLGIPTLRLLFKVFQFDAHQSRVRFVLTSAGCTRRCPGFPRLRPAVSSWFALAR
jgi:hypothetical protein